MTILWFHNWLSTYSSQVLSAGSSRIIVLHGNSSLYLKQEQLFFLGTEITTDLELILLKT